MKQESFSKRNWWILILFGLIGQIAWSVENMYFNLFVFDTISPDLDTVTLMVQLSGIVATLTTLVAGTLSDKVGNRRKFISYGYIIWGVTVALFALISTQNMEKLFGLEQAKAVQFALVSVVALDCVMTVFGSTANDAAFNAWVTDNTKESFRGKVEGVLSVLPLGAMLVVAGGFGILVELIGYQWLFLSLGAVISLCGALGIRYIKDALTLEKNGTLKDIAYGFKPEVIKDNKKLYFTFLLIGVYGVACQIFMPYLIIYMKTFLGFSVVEYSIVFGLAIVLGGAINLYIGTFVDKLDKTRLLYLAVAVMAVGLFGMYIGHFNSKGLTLAVFGIAGFVMITGYILVSAICGALARDYTPKADAGKLQGVRMIFAVLIPMLIGPMIGNAINKISAIPLPDMGSADAMTTQYIPAPGIFLAGALVTASMALLIPFIKTKKPQTGKTVRLKTDYEVGDIPHSEHPTPQSRRDTWQCLNGKWALEKLTADGQSAFSGDILVPFSPETLNSGVAEGFVLGEGESLVYTRKFTVKKSELDGVVKLHFGAVDSECEVFVNGVSVGTHTGGFTAFAFDITSALCEGENELVVRCKDEATRNGRGRGKQSDTRGGIWYTPQSGIWQTVWLEYMPKRHIRGLKITPDGIRKTVKISVANEDETTVRVYDNGTLILEETFVGETVLSYGFELWSPENPKLYDCELICGDDTLYSYFGVRSFGKMIDSKGKNRLTLNGKPYFFNGVLDQGYWSDGMLTYPSDLAAYEELKLLKDMGFNTVRKHIKIEPMRWYYHCDRLGLAVWQDFVNGGGNYGFLQVAALPFLGFHHDDSDLLYFNRKDELGRRAFREEMEETVEQLYNCPCIALWTVFNEGWGQFYSEAFTTLLKTLDDTRIIDSVSGWHDQGVVKTELKSLHTYYTPLRVPKDKRPVVLSEFGGYSLYTAEHVFDTEKEFGYKRFKDSESLENALEKLYLSKLAPLIEKGLCGAIYTQVSDVEEEINGFVTYDRRVVKVSVEKMARVNAQIDALAKKVQ